jgi:hypothetical protein
MKNLLWMYCLALLAAALIEPTTALGQQCPNSVFCGGWYGVCMRTCPRGDCTGECQSRRAACLSSGCFHFNVPRPRCKSNAEDMRLTTACQRMQKEG